MPKKKNILHNGDKVKMYGCLEARGNEDKVWTCAGDSFESCCGIEVVFLEGYRGYFSTEFLKKVKA
jgi:hypothetical protein